MESGVVLIANARHVCVILMVTYWNISVINYIVKYFGILIGFLRVGKMHVLYPFCLPLCALVSSWKLIFGPNLEFN